MEKIINYNWEDIIVRVLKGIQNFVEKIQYYFPKAKPNYEDPANYEYDD